MGMGSKSKLKLLSKLKGIAEDDLRCINCYHWSPQHKYGSNEWAYFCEFKVMDPKALIRNWGRHVCGDIEFE